MIAHLSGKILRKSSDHWVVDVGGIGYKVFVTPRALEGVLPDGAQVHLEIHTVVREDEISLFGFTDYPECRLFEILLSVSGVGPRLAMAILGHCSWQDLVLAIEEEDTSRLMAVKGIGEKTAKMLILGIKNKVAALKSMIPQAQSQRSSKTFVLMKNAEAALLNLGYSRNEIQKTLSSLAIPPESLLQNVVKESLQILSRQVPTGELK